jgi:hypothetical protein
MSGESFGIAEDSESLQPDPFDEAGAFDVESGDDTNHGHRKRASLPFETDSRRSREITGGCGARFCKSIAGGEDSVWRVLS